MFIPEKQPRKSKLINTRFLPKQAAEIERIAEETNQKLSTVIRQMVQYAIDNMENTKA